MHFRPHGRLVRLINQYIGQIRVTAIISAPVRVTEIPTFRAGAGGDRTKIQLRGVRGGFRHGEGGPGRMCGQRGVAGIDHKDIDLGVPGGSQSGFLLTTITGRTL